MKTVTPKTQKKQDKRAAALRENLRKRKEKLKTAKDKGFTEERA